MSMSFDALSSFAFFGLCLALALVSTTGCSGQEPSMAPAGQGELADNGSRSASGIGSDTVSDARAGTGGSAGVEENLALPVLVPVFGLGGNTTECKFTDDPYSTCI